MNIVQTRGLLVILKILVSLLATVHGALFFLLIGSLFFGSGVGELAPQKVGQASIALTALGGLSLIQAITVFFFPGISSAGLIFIMGGLGMMGFWQFAMTGFDKPLNLAIFVLELLLAGIPFKLLRLTSQ